MRPLTRARLTLMVVVLATLSLTPAAHAADEDIVLGFAVALSGPIQPYDADGTRMAELFIDQTNAKGGLLGHKLRAATADTKSDRVEGAKAGLEVIHQGAKLVIATCDYDYGALAALQAQRAGLISVFLCAEDPKAGVLGVGPFSFTSSIAAQIQGATLAEWSIAKKDFRNGYVLLDDSVEYSKSVCAGYDWALPKAGGTILGRDTFKNADPSIASQITRLSSAMRSHKIDAIMLCTYTPGGAVAVRQLRAAGSACRSSPAARWTARTGSSRRLDSPISTSPRSAPWTATRARLFGT